MTTRRAAATLLQAHVGILKEPLALRDQILAAGTKLVSVVERTELDDAGSDNYNTRWECTLESGVVNIRASSPTR